ncbi:DUF2382 domain-containing protein [Nonomuraea sp. SYSU D8015]|uniref:DUF2382 domain-containing protein n=1 Tax=Nonomuraea sp. SYSU D8015 TaxID=2593644 RepID=UPI0016609BF8|nr:PRC and DUF2382 domain-containing protein [Nonomuraea sp. SYSU D8015]
MITREQIPMVLNHPVFDTMGHRVGEAKHVFLDEMTNRPEWLCVRTGLFGTRETFVPLQDAEFVQDHVEVPYDRERIKDAPCVDVEAGGHLSPDQERDLYRYYGIDWGQAWQQANEPTPGGWAHTAGERERERMGGATDEAMTRSEEQLQVGTERYETGRARLRKYVVTEEQQVSVPISREEARVEREPITDANRDAALSGPEISEAEHEVVLHAERPTVSKTTVPKERVRLTKEEVTDEEVVSEEVRKERIEAEGDIGESGSAS